MEKSMNKPETRLSLDYFIDPSLRLYQDPKAFCFNSDSAALALFAPSVKGKRVAEIGCNNGAILLYLDQFSPAFLCGIEIQEQPAELAIYNLSSFAHGDWQIIQGSVNNPDLDLSAGSFDVVLCNPPYFPLPPDKQAQTLTSKERARFEADLNVEGMCLSASRLLRSNGKFACVHRPDRLSELMDALKKAKLCPSRLQIAYDAKSSAASAILLEAVKEGTCAMEIEPPMWYDRTSRPKTGLHPAVAETQSPDEAE